MALSMARPWKHPKTGVYYLRIRVPADLVSLTARTIQKRSLRTKNPAEARRLHLEAVRVLDERWANLRRGMLQPTPREAAAIAGTFYDAIVARHRAGRYSLFGEGFVHAAAQRFRDDPGGRDVHDEFRRVFGEEIKAGLAVLGLNVHPDYAGHVDLAIARAVCDAQEKGVKLVFEGDHSPDPAAAKFPPINEVFSNGSPRPRPPVDALPVAQQFAAYADAARLAPSTRKRWGLALGHLHEHVGHDDLARVTEEDVGRWLDALRVGRLSERTIRDVHLAALKSLCNWLVGSRRLAYNPAADFRIRVPKRVKLRQSGFNANEAATILQAALQPQSRRLGPKHAAARRWVPWLAAYTGARVNELTQLRKQDVQKIMGIPAIVVTPEAGTVKTKAFREVPLHPHLVEQGFLDFVARSRSGPLFYELRPSRSTVTPPYKKLGERLARWVRRIGVDDPQVDPFHGWRHRFKTVGRSVKMDVEVLDALQGHVPRTEGGKYGEFEIGALAEAIRTMPRYEVG